MARFQPQDQPRTQHPPYWGIYATATALPNASASLAAGNLLDALEEGDIAYVPSGQNTGTYYQCDFRGTNPGAASLDAIWNPIGGTGSATVIGPLATIYVEPPAPAGRGNDATGVRGDAAFPFETLDGALAVMQDGDTISLAAGAYAAPSAAIPLALVNGAIVAPSGPSLTTITAVGPALGLDFSAPGGSRQLWTLKGLRLIADPTSFALVADGSTALAASFFANGNLLLNECVIQSGQVSYRYVGGSSVIDCVDLGGATSTWTIECCASVVFLSTDFLGGRDMVVSGDADDLLNPGGIGAQIQPVRFDGACIWSSGLISTVQQGGLYAAPGSVMPAISGSAMTASGLGGLVSQITLLGNVASLQMTPADQTTLIDLQGASFNGNVVIGLAGPNLSNTCRINGIGCTFAGTVQIGSGCRAILRGASFTSDITVALSTIGVPGTHSVVPPTFALAPIPINPGPGLPTSFTFPFELPDGLYLVAVDADSTSIGACATTNRTGLGFDVFLGGFSAFGSIGAIVQYYGSP